MIEVTITFKTGDAFDAGIILEDIGVGLMAGRYQLEQDGRIVTKRNETIGTWKAA